MKANFDISLPSIPGKSIKFKIQDIKSASFGTQKARFPDDKSLLVKKFVDSFHNFHEPIKDQDDQTKTRAETQLSKSFMNEKRQKEPTKFRSMIPENKKFLLPIYQELKKKELKQLENPTESKQFSGGYTFNKKQEKPFNPENAESHQQFLTDNYYFTQDSIHNQQYEQLEDKKQIKRERPSAIFKNQTRKAVYEKLERSIVPGPGAYLKDQNSKKQVKKTKKKEESKKLKNISGDSQMDYNHLKKLISKIIEEQPQEEEILQQEKNKKNDHVFIRDDRDRFGQQIFPIAPKLNVPGPGSYDINQHTLDEKAKKIAVVEQQRKLLREWFNN